MKIAEVLFEKFKFTSIFICQTASLSLYACGKTTGVVCDSGAGVSFALPIYEGFSLMHACERLDIAGDAVTEQLQRVLRQHSCNYTSGAEMEIVRCMKEEVCSFRAPSSPSTAEGTEVYRLPDGNEVTLTSDIRSCCEVVMQPELIGTEYPHGCSGLVYNSIEKCDKNLWKDLYSNVTVTGGNSCTHGFCQRLLSDLIRFTHKRMHVKIHAPSNRTVLPWIGG